MVDEDFARYYWPHSSALGQHLFRGGDANHDPRVFTVAGVVGAVKQEARRTGLPRERSTILTRCARMTAFSLWSAPAFVPESLGPVVQKVVRQIDPEVPVDDIRSMDTRIADSLVTRRSPAFMAALFSLRRCRRRAATCNTGFPELSLRFGFPPQSSIMVRNSESSARAARIIGHIPASCGLVGIRSNMEQRSQSGFIASGSENEEKGGDPALPFSIGPCPGRHRGGHATAVASIRGLG